MHKLFWTKCDRPQNKTLIKILRMEDIKSEYLESRILKCRGISEE